MLTGGQVVRSQSVAGEEGIPVEAPAKHAGILGGETPDCLAIYLYRYRFEWTRWSGVVRVIELNLVEPSRVDIKCPVPLLARMKQNGLRP
ncbi:MAG: hypothetical protein AW11_01354 [Candidatus Accumulibacter regalis]|uniref:Uncharacterized protein n=1 Tax=Accumulibacter regalis TaxID=522306 RepID=A0A011PQE6_ACCRE|nr:MAG: hypothetical protein AW11_01354 [Candidatus Accumulibacter regalis]